MSNDSINKISQLFGSEEFNNASGQLNLPIGYIDTNPFVVDFSTVSHILLSGTTGCGKTTFIQSLISMLMSKYGQNMVQFIIFDSKGIDYNYLNNSNYMHLPVYSDVNEFRLGLNNLLRCAKRRYSSNDCFRQGTIEDPAHLIVIFDDFSEFQRLEGSFDIIDNILLKGRTKGIHCWLSTSNPTYESVPTYLKSNIPCRIAFRTTSKQISRMIIDDVGAEMLVSPGELIYKNNGLFKKVNWTYFNNDEIDSLSQNKIKNLSDTTSLSDLTKLASSAFANNIQNTTQFPGLKNGIKDYDNNSFESDDYFYNDAVEFVAKTKIASTSSLQRRFGIGYNRAAKLLDALEENGLIGPSNGSKPREVYISKKDENKQNNNSEQIIDYKDKINSLKNTLSMRIPSTHNSDNSDISPVSIKCDNGSISFDGKQFYFELKKRIGLITSTATINVTPGLLFGVSYAPATSSKHGAISVALKDEVDVTKACPDVRLKALYSELAKKKMMTFTFSYENSNAILQLFSKGSKKYNFEFINLYE